MQAQYLPKAYAPGSRVAQMPQEETAFYYRDAHFIVWLEAIWEERRFQRENQKRIYDCFSVLADVTEALILIFLMPA